MLATAVAGLILNGCASSPTSSGSTYDPNKPQVFLANANVEQAKGVAMGSAVAKGWRILESSEDILLLQRPLNAAAAESLSPGASLSATPAVIEVRSQFFPRQGGVDVVVDAQAVANRGTEDEMRQDITESYRPELTRSLESLRIAWAESRQRIASAIPPLPVATTPQEETSTEAEDALPAEGADVAATATPSPLYSGVETAWGEAPANEEAGGPAPVESRSIAPQADPLLSTNGVTATPTVSQDLSASMMALNQTSSLSTGVWAYYAEHYARMRGCQVAGDGAVLLEKTPSYEQHRVYCEGGQTFLVKCNAGTCRGTR